MSVSTENVTISPLLDTIDIINQTNTTKKELFIARTDGMLLSYSFLVLSALLCVYFGSYRSIIRQNKQKKSGEKPDVLTARHAALFPLIASVFLFGIYLIIRFISKEYITFILNIYFFLIGIIALYRALNPIMNQIQFTFIQRNFDFEFSENDQIYLHINLNFHDIITLIVSFVIGFWYLLKRHWIANNFLGIAFSINAIEILHFNK